MAWMGRNIEILDTSSNMLHNSFIPPDSAFSVRLVATQPVQFNVTVANWVWLFTSLQNSPAVPKHVFQALFSQLSLHSHRHTYTN